jgi:hypothetical protein
MAVRVYVPTRVRVDVGALFQRRCCIEDALVAAAGRALANSREVVVAQRGGYMGVEVHPPEVHWNGTGLAAIPESVRAEIEQRLEAIWHELIDAAGILDFARDSLKAPEPLGEPPVERVDGDRFHRLLGVYELPSYQEGGTTVITFDEADEVIAGVRQELRQVWRTSFRSLHGQAASVILKQVIADAVEQWGPLQGGTHVGLIWKIPDGFWVRFWPRTRGRAIEFGFGAPTIYVISGSKENATFVPQQAVIQPGVAILRHVTIEDVKEGMIQEISSKIRRHAPRPPIMSEQAYEDQLLAKAEAEANKRLKDFPATTTFIEVLIGGGQYWKPVVDEPHWDGEAYLLPITEEQLVTVGQEDGRPGGGAGEGDGGEGGGAAGPPGGFVITGEEGVPSEGPAALYPPSRYTSGGEQDCSALLGEPPLEALGADAAPLQRLMEEIAHLLQIPVCGHVARFCVNAAAALGSRAATVASFAASSGGAEKGFTTPLQTDVANLGLLQFVPTASPAIQFMRHLAGVTPLISRLSNLIQRIYGEPEHRVKITGTWGNNPAGWSLHFLMELTPRMEESVGYLFGVSCQVILLQLLRSSRKNIDDRLQNIDREAFKFETFIIPQLRTLNELTELRDQLKEYQSKRGVLKALGKVQAEVQELPGVSSQGGAGSASSWITASRALVEVLTQVGRGSEAKKGEAGQIVDDGQTPRIWDSQGVVWTLEGLEQGIVMRRGLVEEIDPLAKQFSELDEVMERFGRSRQDIRGELLRILTEMQTNNQEMLQKTEESWIFAFRASKIREHLPSANVRGTMFALQGVHLQVHEQIGEFFQGDSYYGIGLNGLFNAELGREKIGAFIEFTGLLFLAVVCPPAAFAVGAGVSLYHYSKAKERERLFESLIDPELVLTRAEVEMDLFAAKLGVALSFIPEVGTLLARGAATGVRLGARGSVHAIRGGASGLVRGGVRGAGRAVAERLTKSVVAQIERGLVKRFVEEIATDQLMEQIIGLILTPIMERMEREFAVTGTVGGLSGAQDVQKRLEQERRSKTPPEPPETGVDEPE